MIGEDPVRVLDYGAPEDLRLAHARIRGIDYQHVIVEWLRVERELERGLVRLSASGSRSGIESSSNKATETTNSRLRFLTTTSRRLSLLLSGQTVTVESVRRPTRVQRVDVNARRPREESERGARREPGPRVLGTSCTPTTVTHHTGLSDRFSATVVSVAGHRTS